MKYFYTGVLAVLFVFVSAAASFAQAPANDLCIDAIDINEIFSTELGEQLNVGPFSNVEATGESELAAGLVDDWFDPLEGETLPSVDQSVWFRFTGNGETYQITTYNGPGAAMYANDTQAALYSGTCDDLTLVTANDDLNGFWSANFGWYYSVLNFTAEAGVNYWLMVDGFNWEDDDAFQGISEGTFSLRAVNAEPLIDRGVCSAARPIDEVFNSSTTAAQFVGPFDDTELVTGLGVDYEADMTGAECWEEGTDDGSVWFSFTGDGNSYYLGMFQCQLSNATFVYYFGFDNQLALYKGTCDGLVPVGCSEDINQADGEYWAEIGFDSEEGVEYFLRHDGYHYSNQLNEWSAEGTFCLTSTLSNTTIGISEVDAPVFSVFPNPTAEGVTITWTGDDNLADVTAFDLAGKEVAFYSNVQRGQNQDLGLPSGIYSLRVTTETTSGIIRLQVEK